MKNSTTSIEGIDIEIRKVVLKTFETLRKSNRNLTQNASLDKSFPSEQSSKAIGVYFKKRKFRILLTYVVLFHYYPMDESLRCYFFLDLQDHLEDNPDSFWLTVLLEQKELFLRWLEIQETLTRNEFFSLIVNEQNLIETMSYVTLRFEDRLQRPRKLVRRKGYRDKGTLPDSSETARRQEVLRDAYLTQLQFTIEEKRDIRKQEITLFRDFLTKGKTLEPEHLMLFRIKKGI